MSQELGAEWHRAMLAGDFEHAWQTSDRIRNTGAFDPHRFWQGEPFAGRRVMLRCLHGFGDSIQFLRYAPLLRRCVANLCIEVAPGFVELAPYLDGVEEVITWGTDAPALAPAWDVQMEVTELPYIFRTQPAQLPVAVKYLQVPKFAAPRGEGGLQVGLVWTAGEWDATRSIQFDLLWPLLGTPGCEFWNLQQQPAPPAHTGCLREDAPCRNNLVALARRISQLDLVITVDTLAAHLAGAMGIPAWVFLKHDADWRWMRTREDSPWYPSLRLFRQPAAGDWVSTIALAAAELRTLADRQTR